MRSIFTGKQVVYVYHNQIDARGDKPNTEDEVFVACEEAISEIIDLIHRISTSANTYRFIVTADHGFLYKRDKIAESDKIEGIKSKTSFINRRFVVSPEPVVGDGIASMELGKILRNADTKWVSFPISDDVFKVTGGGQNYVHGSSSPQEMLVPVLNLKMERGHMETRSAGIALVSMAVLGEISIAGTMIKVDELANALQVCLDSGAKKVLLPITSAADLGAVPSELIGCFNLIFYQSAEDAVYKALGVE